MPTVCALILSKILMKNARNKPIDAPKIALLKEGGVSKGGYTLMKMDGKWGVYDKDGLPKPGTENITNPTTLATFIGGTLKKKAKLKG